MTEDVHLLVQRTGDKPARPLKSYTLYARCGENVTLAPSRRQPENFTAWASDVTCMDCLERSPR